MLAITIPTYDRNTKLTATVLALLPQITGECQIVVLDNASPVPVEETLLAALGEIPPTIRIVRNRANVGLIANVLKCFEYAEAEWVWLLADDDVVRSDAVAHILRALHECPEMVYCNFSTGMFTRTAPFRTTGCEELLSRLDSFGNLLLLPSGVYRVSEATKHLRIGYCFANSMASHVAVLLCMAGTSGLAVFKTEQVVEWVKPSDSKENWSTMTMSLGIMSLLELPVSLSNAGFASLRKHLLTHVLPPRLLLLEFLATGPAVTLELKTHLLEQIFYRAFYGSGIVRFPALKLMLARALLGSPIFLQMFLRRFLRRAGPEVISGAERFSRI